MPESVSKTRTCISKRIAYSPSPAAFLASWLFLLTRMISPGEGSRIAQLRYSPELYDLLAAPYELENLVGLEPHREVKRVMRRRLVRRMVEAGETESEIEARPEWKARFHQEG